MLEYLSVFDLSFFRLICITNIWLEDSDWYLNIDKKWNLSEYKGKNPRRQRRSISNYSVATNWLNANASSMLPRPSTAAWRRRPCGRSLRAPAPSSASSGRSWTAGGAAGCGWRTVWPSSTSSHTAPPCWPWREEAELPSLTVTSKRSRSYREELDGEEASSAWWRSWGHEALTSPSSPPASPAAPPCRWPARAPSSTPTGCWSPSPGGIPQSTGLPPCPRRTPRSAACWSEGETRPSGGPGGGWRARAMACGGPAGAFYLLVELLVQQQVRLGPPPQEPHDVLPHLRAQQLRQTRPRRPGLHLRGPQHRRQQPGGGGEWSLQCL